MSLGTRARVVTLWKAGFTFKRIQELLLLEELSVSVTSLCLLVAKFKRTGSVADHRPIRPARKLSSEHYKFLQYGSRVS